MVRSMRHNSWSRFSCSLWRRENEGNGVKRGGTPHGSREFFARKAVKRPLSCARDEAEIGRRGGIRTENRAVQTSMVLGGWPWGGWPEVDQEGLRKPARTSR